MKGTVKFFNTEKRFGFVTGDDGKDYFVHQSAIKDDATIREHDTIEFDTEQSDKGIRAINVVKQDANTNTKKEVAASEEQETEEE